jgi:hypothetical protein
MQNWKLTRKSEKMHAIKALSAAQESTSFAL